MIRFFSLLFFFTFVISLFVRIYSLTTVAELERNLSAPSEATNLFNLSPDQTRQLLDSLGDVVDKSDAIPTKGNKSSLLLSGKSVTRQDILLENPYESIPELKEELGRLDQALSAQEDNFQTIRKIQKKMKKIKQRHELLNNNIEKWPPQLILYFMIEENNQLIEINEYSTSATKGSVYIDHDQYEEFKKIANSKEFLNKILEYKNIDSLPPSANTHTVPLNENMDQYKGDYKKYVRKEKVDYNDNYNQDEEDESTEDEDELFLDLSDVNEENLREKLQDLDYSEEEVEKIYQRYMNEIKEEEEEEEDN